MIMHPLSARIVKDYLTEGEVTLMNWSPVPTDVNPTENAWDTISRAVFLRNRWWLITAALEEGRNLSYK